MTGVGMANPQICGTKHDIYNNGSYLAAHPTWDAEHSPWKAKHVSRMLKKHELNPITVAEVGCGAGEIILSLSQDMPQASFLGYEVSVDAFQLARVKQTDRVNFVLDDITIKNVRYDLLLTMDVFEHVDDYLGFLRNLRGKSEYKIFHIPLDLSCHSLLRDIPMRNRESVGHLHYFTRNTALATLRDCGYEVIDDFYTACIEVHPTKFSTLVRRAAYKMSPDATVLLLGGYALMVLAR
jgi:hypothetical protein